MADQAVEVVTGFLAGQLPVILGVGDAGTTRARHHLRRHHLRRVRPGVRYVAACPPYY